jgi:ATP-binding cassette, subfamily B, bacterial
MERTNITATNLAVRHYFGEVWRNKLFSIPAFLTVSAGAVFTGYVPPLIIAAMINRFGGQSPTLDDSLVYVAMFAGAWFIGEILWRLSFVFLARTEVRAMQHLYTHGLDELRRKDIRFFHDNFAGALTKKAIGYGRNFENFMDTLTFNVAKFILPLLFVPIVLWQFSPWLVASLFGWSAVVIVLLIPLIKRRKKLVDEREMASNHMAGHLADVISNMDTVQAFAHEDDEQGRHAKNVKDHMRKTLRSWDYQTLRIDFLISPIYVIINASGLFLAIALSDNSATIAAIFVTFSYFAFITEILWTFNRTYRNLESSLADAAQFTSLLLEPPEIQDPPEPKPFKVTQASVEFRDVHFSYGAKSKKLFADLDLRIRPGEKIALAGHSGGGKTTITKLLLRFVDVDSGELLIDGQNIAQSRLKDVRQAIAYVPQEPAMFHRTISENIRYGRLDATQEEVIDAAKKANAHEFISQLPDGYETLVGERGVKLSGGQRQRVAIARAIIKDAPILVLDEATSALDSESEKLIQAALWELMKGRTAIVIAHRLSTIQRMDRILVLENGKIIEQGTHQELLATKGVYAKLWSHQSGGFIEE